MRHAIQHSRSRHPGLVDPDVLMGQVPMNITGLIFWVDANVITGLSNNDPVATWSDLSGNSYDFTQATADRKPTYKTNVLGSLPGVFFDGGDALVSATIAFPGTFTLFAVAQSSVNAIQNIIDGDHNAVPRIFQFRYKSSTVFSTIGFGTGSATDDTAAFAAGGTYVFSGVRATSTIETFVDGSSNGSTAIGSTLVSGNKEIYLGAYTLIAAALTGYIHEAIAYDGALSAANRQTIENYLLSKWGLS